jgi:putative ABC transport system permease protein
MLDTFSQMGRDAEIIVRQAGVADTEYSAVDERIGEKIAALPEVAFVSGMSFAGAILPDSGMVFMIIGYAPHEYIIQQVNLVEGERITSSHQVMLGRMMSDALQLGVGDTMELSGSRYKISGIYESGISWEEMGGIFSQRDVQAYMGRPHKVGLYMVKVKDPSNAAALVEEINSKFPEVHAALSGEFVSQMPDMNTVNVLLSSISSLAILVGGVGVLNTMLMAVIERTREIGVLRALGWRRSRILRLIVSEALLLGFVGGLLGIVIAFALSNAFNLVPVYSGILQTRWDLQIFIRAISIALLLGLLGGLYPAFRATRLQPVEALRYE